MLNNIADVCEIISSVFVMVSILIAFLVFKKDHERSRREGSVDLILKWSSRLDKRASLAKKYVEQLSKNQIRHLYAQEEVAFNSANKDEEELCIKIKQLLHDDRDINKFNMRKLDENNSEEKLCLTEEESSELRWLVLTYLNMLESILIAWQHNSVDATIIEQEFAYMFNLSKGRDILQEFRIAAGSEDTYPAIEIFCNHLKEKRKKKLLRKHKI